MKITSIVGKNIQLIRKQKKISQMELAYACNISLSCLSRIEHGYPKMQLAHIAKIAEVLNVSLSTLFYNTSNFVIEKQKLEVDSQKFLALKKEVVRLVVRHTRTLLAQNIEQLLKKSLVQPESE